MMHSTKSPASPDEGPLEASFVARLKFSYLSDHFVDHLQ